MTALCLATALKTAALLGGASLGAALLSPYGAGLAFSSVDDSMAIFDNGTPDNNYNGSTVVKLGSVRSGNAMQWNKNGVLEWAPANMCLRSEEQDNAAWVKSNAGVGLAPVVTANNTTAPDGTLTADKIVFDLNSGTLLADQSLMSQTVTPAITGYPLTCSIWLRADAPVTIALRDAVNTGTYTLVALTTSWQRFSTTGSPATTTSLSFGLRGTITAINSATVYAWGGQINMGSAPGNYIKTTASAYYGLRRDYDPRLSGACGYLIEEARTNILLQSQDLATTWTNGNSTESVNQAVAPDGTTTADKLIPDAASINGRIVQAFTGAIGTTYTLSVFAKQAEFTNFRAYADDNGTNLVSVSYDLSTGAVSTAINVSGGNWTSASSTIASVGNGWWRITMTWTATAVAPVRVAFWCRDTGDGTSGIYLWGAQLEAGAFASSYIPTTTATVTRAADVVTLAGTLFPLNQTEGTLYVKAMSQVAATASMLVVDGASNNEAHSLYKISDNTLRFLIVDGGVTQTSLTSAATVAPLVAGRAAAAYKLDDSAAALAGNTVQSDNVCTMPTTTRMVFGNRNGFDLSLNGWLFEAMYLPTRLTNSQLQSLASGYASDALLLLAGATQGLAFSASDSSMEIKDTTTPANNYSGTPSFKFGSVRTSAAMRYLPTGLLGWGPENLILRSEEFDNGSWSKTDVTITANQSVAPDGTTTMDLQTDGSAGTSAVTQTCNVTPANPITFSVYARRGNSDWLFIQLGGAGAERIRGWFNLATGVAGTPAVVSPGASASASIVSLGEGLYRCILTGTLNGAGSTCAVVMTTMSADQGLTRINGATRYVWGAQLERAASASTYKSTTSAAYYGLRHDYDPRLTGGPGYLVEEARTNTLLRSQEFDNASWASLTNLAVVANDRASPDGTTTAEKITNDTTNGAHRIGQIPASALTATAHTVSIYARAGTGNIIQLAVSDGTTLFYANFLLATAAVGNKHGSATATITAVTDGYYRCTMTFTPVANAGFVNIALLEADTASYNPTYVGTSVNMHIWGAQLEAGAFATSYIPTTSATVTRAKDIPTIPIASLPWSVSNVTLYSKYAAIQASNVATNIAFLMGQDFGGADILSLFANYTTGNSGRFIYGGTHLTGGPTIAALTAAKSAAYASITSGGLFYVNGSQVATNAAVWAPSASPEMTFGCSPTDNTYNYQLNGWLTQCMFLPVALSGAQLGALTA